MAGVKRCIFFLIIGIGVLFTIASSSFHESSDDAVFYDNFEQYSSTRDLNKAYTVWEDGAVLRVELAENGGHSGNQALKVEIVSSNTGNQSVNGSIYHILPRSQRDWSQGTQIHFWVNNTNANPLLLSFNFKEAFNEYWSVNSSGVFFLQNDEGALLQQEIQFGNLPIPEGFQGYVVIPFYSLSVPEWNTASGDGEMDLQRIESYAIAVNIGEFYPGSFILDDFEVSASTVIPTIEILGELTIQVPLSGEHREQYSALLVNPLNKSKKEIEAEWSIQQPADPSIKIDGQGFLTVPAGFSEKNVTIAADFISGELILTNEYTIDLSGAETPAVEPAVKTEAELPSQSASAAYNQSSKPFENWATENRVLFVVIAVGVILLILSLLSFFQRRLK